MTELQLAKYLFEPKRWSPESEIKRLWHYRHGESYIRHLIRLNVSELREKRHASSITIN